MNFHEKTMILILELNYNSRQVAKVIGISTKGAEKKIKKEGSNQFLEKDFIKFADFIEKLQKLTVLN